MKIPGPDHPITIESHVGTVKIMRDGHLIAQTKDALILREANYTPAFYIPRSDAHMDKLDRSEHTSYCPYKGDAAYFSFQSGDSAQNAVWSYEIPYDAVSSIKDHLAFYPDRVDILS